MAKKIYHGCLRRLRGLPFVSLLVFVPPVAIALFPVNVAFSTLADLYPPPQPWQLTRAVCVTTALVLAVCVMLIRLGCSPRIAGTAVALSAAAMVPFGFVSTLLFSLHAPNASRIITVLYCLGALAVGWYVIRSKPPETGQHRDYS